jgi:hypothetical protein
MCPCVRQPDLAQIGNLFDSDENDNIGFTFD